MDSSAGGRIQHSQDIYWQTRQKIPGLVRPQRPGATDLFEKKRPTCLRLLQIRSTRSTTAANKDTYRLLQNHTRALKKSDWWELKPVELQRAADSNNTKCFHNWLKEVWGSKKKGPVHPKSTDGMETFSDSKRVVAGWSEHFQSYSTSLATQIAKLWTTLCSAFWEVWKYGSTNNLFRRLHKPITNAWEVGSVP